MKKVLVIAVLVCLGTLGMAVPTLATNPEHDNEKVTICHAAGLAGTTKYVTLTISHNAVYGPGGHFNENGTTQAGHEQDYLGACDEEEPEDTPLAAGVTFNEATCTSGASFSFVKTALPGIGLRPFYSIEGTLVGGKPVAGESYTITALPVEGYVFEGQTVWTHTFAAAPTNCGEPPKECPNGDLNGAEPGCETIVVPPRCPPPNPDGSYGGKDGKPGNDECKPDPVDETTTTETTPSEPEPVPTTPEPPVTTTPEPPVTTPPTTRKPPVKVKPPVVTKPELEDELDKQAEGNGATPVSPGTVEARNELPNTGLPLIPIALLGAGLVGSGIGLRRK